MFTLFDKDRDGMISCTELGTVIWSLSQNQIDAELAVMTNRADIDGKQLKQWLMIGQGDATNIISVPNILQSYYLLDEGLFHGQYL